MSNLNGWYKSANVNAPTLYQFTNGLLELNITKVIETNEYSGFHYVAGIWTAFANQGEMNTVWTAEFTNAQPLPGAMPA